jgi:NAD(P)-dependent dehydrogenase (short-subunit alcohol dehydrogenase family)
MTSIAGLQGLPHDAPYCASKYAIIGLSKSAAKEVASRGIRVNCVAPATIDTPMLDLGHGPARQVIEAEIRGHTPMGRFGTAEEVAQTVAFLLGPESKFTTGSVTTIDGGMTA